MGETGTETSNRTTNLEGVWNLKREELKPAVRDYADNLYTQVVGEMRELGYGNFEEFLGAMREKRVPRETVLGVADRVGKLSRILETGNIPLERELAEREVLLEHEIGQDARVVRFSPRGDKIAIGGDEVIFPNSMDPSEKLFTGVLQVLSIKDVRHPVELLHHNTPFSTIDFLEFSNDGSLIAIADKSANLVRVRSLDTGDWVTYRMRGIIQGVRFLPDSEKLLILSTSELKVVSPLNTIMSEAIAGTAVAVSSDGTMAAVGYLGEEDGWGRLKVVSLVEADKEGRPNVLVKPLIVGDPNDSSITLLEFSPDETELVVVTERARAIRLFLLTNEGQSTKLEMVSSFTLGSRVMEIKFSSVGDRFAIVDESNVCVYSVGGDSYVQTASYPRRGAMSIDFDCSGDKIVSGGMRRGRQPGMGNVGVVQILGKV